MTRAILAAGHEAERFRQVQRQVAEHNQFDYLKPRTSQVFEAAMEAPAGVEPQEPRDFETFVSRNALGPRFVLKRGQCYSGRREFRV